MLARLWTDSRDELEADFRQFYGLDLLEINNSFSIHHAAVLAAQLPRDSRALSCSMPDLAWSDEMYMLSKIEHICRIILWTKTKDGQHGRNFPEPNDTPLKIRQMREKLEKTNLQEIDELILGVTNGD